MTSREVDMPSHIFSLEEANRLLPVIKRLTDEARRHAEAVTSRLEAQNDDLEQIEQANGELKAIIGDWIAALRELDVEATGLWLVDFDNGEGYYCWSYPEASVSHFHSYDEGFAGRMPIA